MTRLVSQAEVVAAGAAAACAAAQLGASPVQAGDAVAEPLAHLWRWSSQYGVQLDLPAQQVQLESSALHFSLDAEDSADVAEEAKAADSPQEVACDPIAACHQEEEVCNDTASSHQVAIAACHQEEACDVTAGSL